ncbi:hypothetical protein BDQ12DRAFT_329466 [Crucibulum laeve]|uniref:Uncharacterized protein n=1 Tax=Crucibulum laeve TaxID=68775 RepID=A0A5C3LQ12_9AGAR|nr:hypothetical protein BDQ12DRAFT_329466 [Crucibulum laeve]
MPVWIYCIISLLINLIMTTMIITRLNAHRQRITKTLGPNHSAPYTDIMAMIVESALLTLLFLIFVVITFITTKLYTPINSSLVMQILAQVQILSPLWIIYRVVQKRAWSSRTFEEITRSIAFTPGEATSHSSQASSNAV